MAEKKGIRLDERLDPDFHGYTLPLLHALTRRSEMLQRPGLTPTEQYEWSMIQELLGRNLEANLGEGMKRTRELFSRTFMEWLEWAAKQNVYSDTPIADLGKAWLSISAIISRNRAS